MDTDSFIFYVKTEDFYEDIADDVEKWFDTSNYEVHRPPPKGKKQERNWKNERIIRWKDYDKICYP